jgi:hypothetical protein
VFNPNVPTASPLVAQSPVCHAVAPGVPVQAGNCEEAQQRVAALVGSLSERLAPVLRPESPQKTGQATGPGESSALAMRLERLSANLHGTADFLADLLDRLDV